MLAVDSPRPSRRRIVRCLIVLLLNVRYDGVLIPVGLLVLIATSTSKRSRSHVALQRLAERQHRKSRSASQLASNRPVQQTE